MWVVPGAVTFIGDEGTGRVQVEGQLLNYNRSSKLAPMGLPSEKNEISSVLVPR
jgi:hypothetical protein